MPELDADEEAVAVGLDVGVPDALPVRVRVLDALLVAVRVDVCVCVRV